MRNDKTVLLHALSRHRDAVVATGRTAGTKLRPIGVIIRTAFLLVSSSDHAKWKNVWFALAMLRNARARRVWRKYFDSSWYRNTYTDVSNAAILPGAHYLLKGHLEGRSPSDKFDSVFYLRRHPDVKATGINPLLHYSLFGAQEKRTTAPCIHRHTNRAGRFESHADPSGGEIARPPLVAVVIAGDTGDNDKSYADTTLQPVQAHTLPDVKTIAAPSADDYSLGIQQARSKYVCCLSRDDRVKPHYLEVAAFLAETYGYHVVSPSPRAYLQDSDDKHLETEPSCVSTGAMFARSAWNEVCSGREFKYTDCLANILHNGFRVREISQPLLYTSRVAMGNAAIERTKKPAALRPLTPELHAWRNLLGRRSEGAMLFALPFVTIGGAEKLFETIMRSQMAQGRTVIVITTVISDAIKDASDYFQAITPYVYSLPHLFGEQEDVWDDFVSYLVDQYSIDLVMIAGCDYMYHALPDFRAAFPAVGVADQLFNDQVHFYTNRHYADFIDMTMVPSREFAARLTGEFRESAEKVAVIPHGVDIPDLSNTDTANARRIAGLPDDWRNCFIAGFFGRLSPEKAPTDFVEMVHMLKAESNLRFVLTGEGPESARVRESILRYGLEDRIYAPGFVDNPAVLMAAVDVVVVPSRLDGMPLVVMESQALGKPVIASAVGSIPVMIEDDYSGFLCPPADIGAFAAKVRELHASAELRARIGRQARSWAEAHHSASAMLRRYDEAFTKARTRHARPDCTRI
jgi:O-antigen biosynthesis protein